MYVCQSWFRENNARSENYSVIFPLNQYNERLMVLHWLQKGFKKDKKWHTQLVFPPPLIFPVLSVIHPAVSQFTFTSPTLSSYAFSSSATLYLFIFLPFSSSLSLTMCLHSCFLMGSP